MPTTKRPAILVFAFLACALLVSHSRPVSALSTGTLIKGSGSSVYFYATDGKRHIFPTEKIYDSWYSGFTGIITLSDADLAAIQLGANVTYHPGTRMVKIQTDPKVYAVSKGGVLHWIASESVASALYGPSWNTMIDDIPDAFFFNYPVGNPINSASDFDLNAAKSVSSINDDFSPAPSATTTSTSTAPATTTTTTSTSTAPSTTTTTTANLISDPGFESGTAGFYAQETTDAAVRTTTAPITGAASLEVTIKSWGNNAWWTYHASGTPNGKASKLTVTGKLRGDTVRGDTTFEFCAAVYYADGGDVVQKCAEASKIQSQTTVLVASIDLDATRALGDVDIRMTTNGPGPVAYALDGVSAVLTLPAGSTTSTPTTTTTTTPPSTTTPPPTTTTTNPGTAGYTAMLTTSGSTSALPVIADAQDPSEPNMTPAFHVSVPTAQCNRMLGFVNPAIAIPTTSKIREVEATWNGTPLSLIDPSGAEVAEDAHAWGSMVGFFKPLFSLSSIPAGSGTLAVKAFDGGHNLMTTVSLPNLTIATPPAPLTAAQIAAQSHPRIYLTPSRLAQIKAKPSTDPTVQRFWSKTGGVGYFLQYYTTGTDPESSSFQNQVYNPEDYIPALALCYQLDKTSDPTTAAKCADAGKKLTLAIANGYNSGARSYSNDDGYDIRFQLRDMMLAYDWMYDEFSASDRSAIAKAGTGFVDWFTASGYANKTPIENYYAGYLQGITLTAVATAGDNAEADRLLTLLRNKLTNEVPVMNQRLCGGDFPEGWNYGPYTMLELSLVNQTLKDAGEDWSADFDFIQSLARSFTYQVTPDMAMTVPFGDYSGDLPHKTTASLLAVLSSTTSDGPLATRLYNAMVGNPASDVTQDRGGTFYEMIFGNTTQSASLSGMPLSYLNAGTGRFFSKSSLTDTSGYEVTADNVSYYHDHYGYANGDVQLWHGSTCLLCSSAYRGPSFIGLGTTKDFSTYMINGKDASVNRNNQMLFDIDQGAYSALGMRFESSFPTSRYDEGMMDPAMPLDYLIREVVHVRPGVLVVRDLHRRRHSTDTLVANWHLGPTGTVQTIAPGQYKVGNVNVETFAPTGTTSVFSTDVDAKGNAIGTLMRQTFPNNTNQMETVTVISDVASASSYVNGTVKLSTGQCVNFANGGVSVASCQ